MFAHDDRVHHHHPSLDSVSDARLRSSRQGGLVAMGTFHKVAETKNLAPGKSMAVEVAGNKLALFNVDGTFYAIGDTCTHRGGPLSEGSLEGSTVTCPWHGANFDVCTGKNLTPPALAEVTSYNVRVAGDDVEIEIS
jgi:nitrite reductase/ring-hydroxylating ferredoxin subunit